MAKDSVWSVDAIAELPGLAHLERPHSLVRLVHLADTPHVGVRHLLVQDQCVDIRRYTRRDDSPRISFGLSYSLAEDKLRAAVRRVSFGSARRAMPVLSPRTLRSCLRRDIDAETTLRREIRGYLRGADRIGGTRSLSAGGQSQQASITVFDVGQGDTILLEFPDRILWLIDAFFSRMTTYERFKDTLRKKFGSLRLDRLVISHFHYDHIRNALDVIRDFDPKEVVVTDTLAHPIATARNLLRECQSKGILRVISRPEKLTFSGLQVDTTRTYDFPGTRTLGPDPNEHGLAVSLKTERSRALLPGDIPGQLLAGLVTAKTLTGDAEYRFYKVTHHCSGTGNTPALFNAYAPNDAATSCASSNRYGHPNNPPEGTITSLCKTKGGRHQLTCRAKQDLTYVIR